MLALPYNSAIYQESILNTKRALILLILAIILFPISEIIRVYMPGQPVVISGLPLLCLTWLWLVHLKRAIPSCLYRSVIPILILCGIGLTKAVLEYIPTDSIVKSLTSELVWFVPAFVLYRLARIQSVRYYLTLTFAVIIVLSLFFTLYNIFAGSELWFIPKLHGTVTGRLYGDEFVSYYYGIFRTAPTYSQFIVYSTVPLFVTWLSNDSKYYSRTARIIVFVAMLSLLPQAILAGRRSQFMMVTGVLCGCFMALTGTIRRIILGFLFTLILFIFLVLYPSLLFSQTRLAHNTGYLWRDFVDRAKLNVLTEEDFRVLTPFGHGSGAAGYAALMSRDKTHREKAREIAGTHLAMHYGWYQCIYTYGYVGLIMKLICFGNIFFIFVRQSLLGSKAARISLGLFIMVMLVYFFIQTSFLESITGGVLFGMVTGYGLSLSCIDVSENVERVEIYGLSSQLAKSRFIYEG